MNDTRRIVMAFDYGCKYIGVAIGQELTGRSRPLATVQVFTSQPDWPAIHQLIDQWQPDVLVVGLPLNLDGTKQQMPRLARRFAGELQARFPQPIAMADERLTTVEAHNLLGNTRSPHNQQYKRDKQFIHQAAAQVILEAWFTEQRKQSGT